MSTILFILEVTIYPLIQIVAANVSVMFRCSGISKATGTILINNYNYDNYFTNSGITFQNSTVTLIATKDKNNTVFQCCDVIANTYSSMQSRSNCGRSVKVEYVHVHV